MLHSIKDLYGKKLGALDGAIGRVKDFYFDDQQWLVRYVVADTGSWLNRRQVLISPHTFGRLHQEEDSLWVNLTRQQIEDSPSIEEHKPVSRQYEEEYFRYYGWPIYWEGAGFYGLGANLEAAQPANTFPMMLASEGKMAQAGDDPHLRSTKSVRDHHIETSEGSIGHVTDFVMDEQAWKITSIIVRTGSWLAGKQVAISPSDIDHISYERCAVIMKLAKEEIRNLEEFHYPEPRLIQKTSNLSQ